MNDSVIERVAREDPVRREPGGAASRRRHADATRARVLAAIEDDREAGARPARGAGRALGAVAMAAAPAVVAAIVVTFLAVGHHARSSASARSTPRHRPATIAPGKPVGLHAAGVVDIGGSPQALLAHGNSLWIATPKSLVRVNLQDGSTIARTPIATDGVNAGLAGGAGSVWLASTGASQLLRIDPATNRLVASIHLGEGRMSSLGGGVTFAAGRIWVTRDSTRPRGDVIAANPATDRPEGSPITVGSGPAAIASGFGSLWVDNTSLTVGNNPHSAPDPAISRIDQRNHDVTAEPFAGTPSVGFGSLWIQTDTGGDASSIIRVDPATAQTLAQIHVPRVVGVAFGDGRVWAIAYPRSRSASTFQPVRGTAALWQIDPQTNRVVGKPIHLQAIQPISIVVSGGQLWIGDYQSGKLIHFQLTKR